MYYALLALVISYGYVVEFLPRVKPAYVALVSSLPILIVARFFPAQREFAWVAGSVSLFVFGREVCMDHLDANRRQRRVQSQAHVGVGCLAVSLQGTGIVSLILAVQVRNLADWSVALSLVVLTLMAAAKWFRGPRPRTAVRLMKFQMFAALYFLY